LIFGDKETALRVLKSLDRQTNRQAYIRTDEQTDLPLDGSFKNSDVQIDEKFDRYVM